MTSSELCGCTLGVVRDFKAAIAACWLLDECSAECVTDGQAGGT